MIGKQIRELPLPADALVALVSRDGQTIIPRGDTKLHAGDHVMVIGQPEAIDRL